MQPRGREGWRYGYERVHGGSGHHACRLCAVHLASVAEGVSGLARRQCGGCDHYEDLLVGRCDVRNGIVGVCCRRRDRGDRRSGLRNVDPRDGACDQYKEHE